MTIYQGLNFCGQSNLSKSMKWWDLGPFEDKQAGLVQSMGAKGKTSWEAVEIGTCQSRIYPNLAFCCAKSAECIDSWFHQLYLMASLRMSRRSGQSELKRCVHLTDRIANFVTWTVANGWINWHLTVAKCAVPSGLSQRLCLNKRAVRICVAGCFNWREGDPSLVSVTLHSHITLSPATFHPVQCRANMRVADCSTVWVCKCLQLIYLPALHLTLFDIYSTI